MGSPGEPDSLSKIGVEVDSRILNNGWREQVGPYMATQFYWEAGELRKGSHVGSEEAVLEVETGYKECAVEFEIDLMMMMKCPETKWKGLLSRRR